jgi:hypothetical protein
MTTEYQTEIKKSDEKWHASDATKIAAGVAIASVVGSLLTPDPQFKRDLATVALLTGNVGAVFLSADAFVGSVRNKLKEVAGKQKSS